MYEAWRALWSRRLGVVGLEKARGCAKFVGVRQTDVNNDVRVQDGPMATRLRGRENEQSMKTSEECAIDAH